MGKNEDVKNINMQSIHTGIQMMNSDTEFTEKVSDTEKEHVHKRQETTEDLYGEKESIKLLRFWGLEQYTKVLIVREGYDEIEDWKELTFDDLISYGFKGGHSKKFLRKVLEHFDGKEGVNEGNMAQKTTTTQGLMQHKWLTNEIESMYMNAGQVTTPTTRSGTNTSGNNKSFDDV